MGDTWRNIAAELDRIRLVTIETEHGTVSQRTKLTDRQRQILKALGLSEPPHYFEFTPTGTDRSPAGGPKRVVTRPVAV